MTSHPAAGTSSDMGLAWPGTAMQEFGDICCVLLNRHMRNKVSWQSCGAMICKYRCSRLARVISTETNAVMMENLVSQGAFGGQVVALVVYSMLVLHVRLVIRFHGRTIVIQFEKAQYLRNAVSAAAGALRACMPSAPSKRSCCTSRDE